MVYLTGDSDNDISEDFMSDKNTGYVIGCIVDRNRYKKLTLKNLNYLE